MFLSETKFKEMYTMGKMHTLHKSTSHFRYRFLSAHGFFIEFNLRSFSSGLNLCTGKFSGNLLAVWERKFLKGMKFKIDVCVEVLLNFENVDSGADFSTFQKLYYNYS
jgi:hypothetical protein